MDDCDVGEIESLTFESRYSFDELRTERVVIITEDLKDLNIQAFWTRFILAVPHPSSAHVL